MPNKKFVRKHTNVNDESAFTKYFTRESIGFRTINSSYFKKLMNFTNGIVDQINIKLDRDGLRFTSMDNSHISLVDVFVPKFFFKAYNNNDETISIGIDLNILNKVLNHLNSEDELIFTLDNDKLDVSFINEKYKKFYSLKLLNIDYDELDIQDLENPVKIKLDSRYFNDIISHFNDIGDNVEFQIKEKEDDVITLKSEGPMTELNIVIETDDIEIENLDDLNMFVNMKNLQNFSKGYSLNKNMTIEMTENYPLKLSYKIMDIGYINYYIAPKIVDDDDY